jgi:hypothetical protein
VTKYFATSGGRLSGWVQTPTSSSGVIDTVLIFVAFGRREVTLGSPHLMRRTEWVLPSSWSDIGELLL